MSYSAFQINYITKPANYNVCGLVKLPGRGEHLLYSYIKVIVCIVYIVYSYQCFSLMFFQTCMRCLLILLFVDTEDVCVLGNAMQISSVDVVNFKLITNKIISAIKHERQ